MNVQTTVRRMQLIGLEVSEGIGKKSGKPYAMAALYTVVDLAAPFGEGNVAKGAMGAKLELPAEVGRRIAHLPFPIVAEVESRDVMRFGERKEEILDVRPVDTVKAQKG